MKAIGFIKEFYSRKGLWMLGANAFTKLLGFVALVFVTRNSTAQEFGAYAYALNLVLAIVPFMGLGAYQAFLRYSSDAQGQTLKKELFYYAYARGIIFSMALVVVLLLLAPYLCKSIPESIRPFRILSFVILTTLNMEFVKSYARAIHLNGISAKIDITYAVSLLVLSVILILTIGIIGYAVAVAVAPVVAVLYQGWKMNLASIKWVRLNSIFSGFWKYGVFTTIGALLAQLFYAIDIFMIGHFVGDKASSVAIYRVAIIIPIATLVIPVSISATDYVKNSANKFNVVALKSYMKNYWMTFGWLSLFILSLLWLLAPCILGVFGQSYREGGEVMRIFLAGILGAHLLRIPFGNLLSAVGKAEWNTYINLIVLILTGLLCVLLIPDLGILGAAYSMTIMLWVSGILNGFCFWLYLRKVE